VTKQPLGVSFLPQNKPSQSDSELFHRSKVGGHQVSSPLIPDSDAKQPTSPSGRNPNEERPLVKVDECIQRLGQYTPGCHIQKDKHLSDSKALTVRALLSTLNPQRD